MPRSSAKTLAAIHQAGFELFHKRGYTRVSMDEIAAAAGVTKRTLYYHYDSKDALVGAVLNQQLEASLKTIQKWGHPRAATAALFVDGMFQKLIAWAQTTHWTGSGFTRLTLELADLPGHPARKAASKHKADVERWISAELATFNIPHAGDKARMLCLLIEGATVLTLIHGDTGYLTSAAQTAAVLIDAADDTIEGGHPA